MISSSRCVSHPESYWHHKSFKSAPNQMLVEKFKQLKIGDGFDDSNGGGPVVRNLSSVDRGLS